MHARITPNIFSQTKRKGAGAKILKFQSTYVMYGLPKSLHTPTMEKPDTTGYFMPGLKRSKGRAFDKQLCVIIVTGKGMIRPCASDKFIRFI
jgi:hypothetical protein